MTYSQFLNSLLEPIQSFLTWLGVLSDALLSNYFFITIFGFSIFVFIFTFGFNLVNNFRIKKRKDSSKYN